MKTMVSCDSVFEILTSAPFPRGEAGDVEVEAHLRLCHECRTLAEALRPAVRFFHESQEVDASLPCYHGPLAERLVHANPTSKRREGLRKWFINGFAASLATCLLAWLCLPYWNGERKDVSVSSKSMAATPDSVGWETLKSLRLPLSCLPASRQASRVSFRIAVVDQSASSHTEKLGFLCCAECHRPRGTGVATVRAMQALNTACLACHRPMASFETFRSNAVPAETELSNDVG